MSYKEEAEKVIEDDKKRSLFPRTEHYINHADGLKASVHSWLWACIVILVLIIIYIVAFPFFFKFHVCILGDLLPKESLFLIYFTLKYSVTLFLTITLIISFSVYKRKSDLRNIYYDKASSVEYLENYHEEDPKVRQKIFAEVLNNSHIILDKKKRNSIEVPLLKELLSLIKK